MGEYNAVRFRELLKDGIGEETQLAFSKRAGIANETISRMLNQKDSKKPKLSTLQKIIKACGDRISADELYAVCGYGEEFQKAKGDIIKDSECFHTFLSTLCGKENSGKENVGVVDSIEDYIRTVLNQTGADVNYVIGNERSGCFILWGGNYCKVVQFSMPFGNGMLDCDVAFFYDRLPDQKLKLSFMTNDARIAAEYGGEVAPRILKLRLEADSDEVSKQFADVGTNVLYTKKRPFEGVSAEERLLKSIFGWKERNTIVQVSGMGFFLPKNMPEYVFKRFLKEHKYTFVQTEQEADIYNSYVLGDMKRLQAFSYYKSTGRTGAGSRTWLAAIINIIQRETGGINTQGWSVKDEDDIYMGDSIVFSTALPWNYNEVERNLTKDKLVETLDKYALELQTNVEFCTFTSEVTTEIIREREEQEGES